MAKYTIVHAETMLHSTIAVSKSHPNLHPNN